MFFTIRVKDMTIAAASTSSVPMQEGQRQDAGHAALVRLLARQAAAEYFAASRNQRDRR